MNYNINYKQDDLLFKSINSLSTTFLNSCSDFVSPADLNKIKKGFPSSVNPSAFSKVISLIRETQLFEVQFLRKHL